MRRTLPSCCCLGWRLSSLLFALHLVGCTPYFGDDEAALVLEDMVVREGSSRLAQSTPAPSRATIRFEMDGRRHKADLYTPATTPRANIILIPGLALAGKNDPRLVALARTLGRVGFEVFVPDIPGFRALHLRSSDVLVFEDSVRYLDARPGVSIRPLGIGAFSFAVGPAVVALLRPPVRNRVSFLVGVGGYYDLRDLVAFYTKTRGTERSGLIPDERGKWILALSLAEQLRDPGDRRALERLARGHLYGRAKDTVRSVATSLGPDGRAVLALLENTDPERVPELVSRLPEEIRGEIAALNPADQDLARIRAELILVHGRDDNVIPYTQSVALARAVPEGKATLYLLDGLVHMDLSPRSGDVSVALAAIDALLAQREPVAASGARHAPGPLSPVIDAAEAFYTQLSSEHPRSLTPLHLSGDGAVASPRVQRSSSTLLYAESGESWLPRTGEYCMPADTSAMTPIPRRCAAGARGR